MNVTRCVGEQKRQGARKTFTRNPARRVCSGIACLLAGVSMMLGATLLTRMPCSWTFAESDSTSRLPQTVDKVQADCQWLTNAARKADRADVRS